MVGPFCTSNFRAIFGVVATGMGVAMLPYDLFAEEITSHKLVRVLPDWNFPPAEIFAVYPSKDLKPAKLVAFLDALKTSDFFKAYDKVALPHL